MVDDQYFFLRLSMAVGKAAADAARGVEGASVLTAMAFNCRGFALRVSGPRRHMVQGPHASVEAKLFEGHSEDEITWMGGESIITENRARRLRPSLGAGASELSGRLLREDDARNKELYAITVGEKSDTSFRPLAFAARHGHRHLPR